MADWPLHITLADVFAIDLQNSDIEADLAALLSDQPPLKTFAIKEAVLGTAEVVLLNNNDGLTTLHTRLVDLLEKNGAKFNTPGFTREGFIPHCTIQKGERLQNGDEVTISIIAFVDMFPSENWQQRKVIKTFKLQADHKE